MLVLSPVEAEPDSRTPPFEQSNVNDSHQDGSEHPKDSPLKHAGRLVREGNRSFGFEPFFCVITKVLSTLKPRVAHLRDVTARHDRLPKSDLDPNDPVVEVTPRNMWIWGITRCNDGGSATIYRGRHYRLGKVALKHLRPDKDHCTRFSLEVKAWQRLKHPRILPFLGIHKSRDNCLYMVSPWVQNGRILDHLKRRPEFDRILFLVEVSEALAYIHDKGMIHGDVKSANVLVSDEEHALVCDLGLSRSTGTTTNAALKGDGSHNYQAPELFNGASKTAKSDVYAFGITIYEILSGQEWYISNIYGAVVTAVTKGGRPLTHNPATSPTGQSYAPVWEMAEKCWIHDPSARPTMKEVFQELRRLVGSVPNEVSSYRRDLGGV